MPRRALPSRRGERAIRSPLIAVTACACFFAAWALISCDNASPLVAEAERQRSNPSSSGRIEAQPTAPLSESDEQPEEPDGVRAPTSETTDEADPPRASDGTPATEGWIDVHTHLLGPGVTDVVIDTMEENGISWMLNLSGGSPRRGMSRAIELHEATGGRVLNLMTIDWSGVEEVSFAHAVAAELELAVAEYGYVGLKVSKALGLFVRDASGELLAVDDPRLAPIWRQAGELDVPVFIHTADPKAFWEPVTPENERYAELLAHPSWSFAGDEFPARETLLAQRDRMVAQYPATTFVAVHFGNNPEDIEYVDELLQNHPNVYVDIAARIGEIGRHDPAVVREVFVRHQDRILFGTDLMLGVSDGEVAAILGSSGTEAATVEEIPTFYQRHRQFLTTDERAIPHPTPIQGDWTVDAIGLPDDVLAKVVRENAYRLVVSTALERR